MCSPLSHLALLYFLELMVGTFAICISVQKTRSISGDTFYPAGTLLYAFASKQSNYFNPQDKFSYLNMHFCIVQDKISRALSQNYRTVAVLQVPAGE